MCAASVIHLSSESTQGPCCRMWAVLSHQHFQSRSEGQVWSGHGALFGWLCVCVHMLEDYRKNEMSWVLHKSFLLIFVKYDLEDLEKVGYKSGLSMTVRGRSHCQVAPSTEAEFYYGLWSQESLTCWASSEVAPFRRFSSTKPVRYFWVPADAPAVELGTWLSLLSFLFSLLYFGRKFLLGSVYDIHSRTCTLISLDHSTVSHGLWNSRILGTDTLHSGWGCGQPGAPVFQHQWGFWP